MEEEGGGGRKREREERGGNPPTTGSSLLTRPRCGRSVAAVANVGLNYYLVFGEHGFGFIGSPICMVIIQWTMFIALQLWVRCGGLHRKCWAGWSAESLRGWPAMIKLGLSGVAAVMGEWWAWEINTAFAGNLGPIALAAHASLQNLTFYYYVSAQQLVFARLSPPSHGAADCLSSLPALCLFAH